MWTGASLMEHSTCSRTSHWKHPIIACTTAIPQHNWNNFFLKQFLFGYSSIHNSNCILLSHTRSFHKYWTFALHVYIHHLVFFIHITTCLMEPYCHHYRFCIVHMISWRVNVRNWSLLLRINTLFFGRNSFVYRYNPFLKSKYYAVIITVTPEIIKVY